MTARAGHRLLPHTADLTVEAWAPTREECLAEAVHGLVASFADTAGAEAARPGRRVPFACPPESDTELLVRVLDEVIYLLDVRDVVPVRVALMSAPGGGLTGHVDVVDRAAVRPVGPAPKAVTRHGLRLAPDAGVWRCTVTVDV
jgi:SHS2 domain-containing protein